MSGDSSLAAVAAVVKSLATDPTTPPALSNTTPSVKLPGSDTAEKTELERELAALVLRVQQLEARANSATTNVFPDTPNETADSIFADEKARARPKYPTNLPRNGFIDEAQALEDLREHVDDQSKLLDSQRQELDGVNAQLLEQKQLQEKALAIIEQERVATLERELWKHQKANEAFQKALREIGEIVTAVARGDLSKKVRMNSVEMDPEITTFKRTINTMMDQLQVFSSEVSRVAREVGTEGILGGQAQIEGVDGTWKELTDNGPFFCRSESIAGLSVLTGPFSERHGAESHGSRYVPLL
jgi:osomolarity two-component system sensor histidine kinase NIK1